MLRQVALLPPQGVRLTLIGREPHTPYSGMLPGLIRRDYGFDEAHIDLAKLAAASGARLILAEADGIDLAGRTVALAGRPALAFDTLSLDVGGLPAMPADGGTAVKPIGQFLERLEHLEATLAQGARIAIVGAGPAGTELALALARRFGGRMRIALIGAGTEPLAGA
ncbi:MAG: FAD-dependent oxidoreductase, partial [Acetobacteraceae bacterium]